MPEGCEDVIPLIATLHGSDDITRRFGMNIGAFHQSEIAVFGGAQQGLEIGADVIRDQDDALRAMKLLRPS